MSSFIVLRFKLVDPVKITSQRFVKSQRNNQRSRTRPMNGACKEAAYDLNLGFLDNLAQQSSEPPLNYAQNKGNILK